MNWAKVTNTPIRGLQLAQRERDTKQLPDRRGVSGPEQVRRLEPLVGLMAHGHIPVDETGAAVVAQVLGRQHKQVQRAMRKKR